MIRINLLGVERQKAKRTLPTFTVQAKQLTVACSLILVASAAGIGWWVLDAHAERGSGRDGHRDGEAGAAASAVGARGSQGVRRPPVATAAAVQVIEQLRSGQTLPVQLLDHISRSVPDLLWLTDMDQKGDALTIQGRCNTIIAPDRVCRQPGNSGC
jgi:hypothetical protein